MKGKERGNVAADGVFEYRQNRLWFWADVIEALDQDQMFRIVTPVGTFQMTRAEFYQQFPNVVASNSYQNERRYHYPKVPAKAERFLV